MAPFGDDFATWSGMAERPRLLPRGVQNEATVEEAPNEGVAPRNPNNVIADAPQGPKPDFWDDWRAAEERSRARLESGQPSVTDLFFAAVFGNHAIRGRQQVETDEMRDRIRRRDY